VIVAENWATAWPAKEAQSTIPVVFIVESDPAAQGLIESLARPGGHLTGLTHDNLAVTAGKRLELLTEATPGIRRVAVLFDPRHNPGPLPYTRTAAGALHIELLEHPVPRTVELDYAFESLAQEPADALIMFSGGVINSEGSRLLRFAREHRLPTMLDFGSWVADATSGESALMCYNPSEVALYRRLADYVDKILKGARPRDIPVERPVDYELAINLKVAEAIGVTISRSVLGRATRVIR
jgi:putative ABC transport system substrate-binding protein